MPFEVGKLAYLEGCRSASVIHIPIIPACNNTCMPSERPDELVDLGWPKRRHEAGSASSLSNAMRSASCQRACVSAEQGQAHKVPAPRLCADQKVDWN